MKYQGDTDTSYQTDLSIPEGPPPPYSLAEPSISQAFKPVIIPQVTKAFDSEIASPFMRAYSPALSQYQISQTDFLTFLDGLNEVFIANPVLQATGIAGAVMGNIHPIEIVGMAVETASEIGSETTSYFRTRAYLKKVNTDLFGPRGLKAKIMDFEKMARAVDVHPDGLKDRMEREAGVLEDQDVESVEDIYIDLVHRVIADGEGGGEGVDAQGRNPRLLLLDALQGHVSPLETEGLPVSPEQRNLLKRWNASFATREGQKQHDRLEKKFRKAKQERAEKYKEALEIGQEMEKDVGKIEAKIGKVPEKEKHDERKIERKTSRLVADMEQIRRKKVKKMRDVMKDGDEKLKDLQRKDMEKTLKIKWVVISSDTSSTDGEN
ncbi:hypothetical protein ASPVEDRAFT_82418 [Aspergillus versicolor CBS 583.65]|uniref:Uncharacterized protein n=1 Tax=Aspergillus versicolor CBS 583.65 TaxID=1036611 RepID=A0A1L9PHD0_ASPVE|nr:uncharacterized protein ASPVEDRAFT_82418 [Aspergillus versicolor CBS 583.65]OJJ00866.1 hypothetical protein ASPVEDRAFT_82418 [Aspergillus versicolor CBS 583.65]